MAFTNPTEIFTLQACLWLMLAGALVFGSSCPYILPVLDDVARSKLTGRALHLWGRVRQGGIMAGEE